MAHAKLSAVKVRTADAGKYGDGGGLWLIKQSRDTGSWMLRVSVNGRLRHMGLGSIDDVGLADARLRAGKWRAVAQAGRDPILERERERRDAARNMHTLKEVALDAFEAQKAGLRLDGKPGRWFGPLQHHVMPRLGPMPVADVDQIAIRDALKPIWTTTPVVAEKALQRLGIVLRHAAALGYEVDLQAVAKARALLGPQGRKVKHIPSVPWADVPEFFGSLTDPTPVHLALRFLILTGLRSAPVRLARWDHVQGEVLTVPAELVKGGKGRTEPFRVPLSPEALAVLADAKPLARNGLIFPSQRGVALSDMGLSRHMERRGMDERPHGFRSSLRVFLAEKSCPRDVAEAILGHVFMGKVEASYMRSDLLAIRRGWLERWSSFVTTGRDAVAEHARAEHAAGAEIVMLAAS